MSSNTNNGPMLKAAGLWAKTSVKGGQYLTGRLGGVKVLVMENHDRQSDDDPSHHLFFLEPPDRLQGGQERAQERPDGQGKEKDPGRTRSRHSLGAAAYSPIGSPLRIIRRRSGVVRCRYRPGIATTMLFRSGRGDPPRPAMMPDRSDRFGPLGDRP